MTHLPDARSVPDTFTEAENALVENLCNRRDYEKGIYGGIRRRISTAYVLANSAFKKYTTGCMGSNEPFQTTTLECTYASSVIHKELLLAANDTVISGYGPLPPVGNMLYRLLALSVVAEHDRRENYNACFRNLLAQNATEMCQDIYDDARATNPGYSPGETVRGYETVVNTLTSCDDIYRSQTALSQPSPPPSPNWNFAHPFVQGMGAVNPTIDACRNVHSFGHFDQQSAFGIPDIIHPFSWKPAAWDFPASLFHNALFTDKMKGVITLETNPINALKLHNAYRLSVASAMMILTGACCGYWIGFSGTPLVAFCLYRCGGVENGTPSKSKTILAPQLRRGGFLVLVTTLLVWAYSSILDPWLPAARSYTTSPFCGDWHKTTVGSVFVTSDRYAGPWEVACGYLFVATPLYAAVYNWRCRTLGLADGIYETQSSFIPRIPDWFILLLFLQSLSIILFVLLALKTGDMWFDGTVHKRPDWHHKAMPHAQKLVGDLSAATTVAILGGVACSVYRQRWSIAQMSNTVHFCWGAFLVSCIVIPFVQSGAPQHFLNTIENNKNMFEILVYICYLMSFGTSLFVVLYNWNELGGVPKTKEGHDNAVNRYEGDGQMPTLVRLNTN